MSGAVEHIRGVTFHGRRGAVRHAFRYGVDYVLLDAEEAAPRAPRLFSRNGRNLFAVFDRDHGGPRGAGRGAAWVRALLAEHGLDKADGPVRLLTQPRVLGMEFNPVSFWLCFAADGSLRAVIAEVNNTFGDRHNYLCAHPDQRPITPCDRLAARKVFHVSPFQPIAGGYSFRFDIGAEKLGIWIDFSDGAEGLCATLTGPRKPLTNRGILGACLRRPLGAVRVLGLIHWQAFRLALKGARYRAHTPPPAEEVTR
ncbi:DUF1365 domain-containing protein [Actibacterium sp. MT2.3-13A]|uniref:DUF1365 domain-containing protein n=1 Tax=Actibacterium sp. MT2.3-13A TaxID=2828332 RepID=UPI001BAB9B87|nr:DUF1365 domain-containing protein [Actibacterium sp. MT2.3-13A]